MDGLIEGRIVHYVLNIEDNNFLDGEHRPAIVVRVWDNLGTVNLQVFMDGDGEEGPGAESPLLWKTGIPHDQEDKRQGTWHWIERQPQEVRTE